MMETFKLNTISEAVDDFRDGKFVIVVDDEDRENEGDLICAAEKITPEMVNFMLKYARGVLCAPITISRSEELDLPRQVSENTSVLGTPFTVTVDKLEGCTTGVSAHDRAATIQALADPTSTPKTFGRPGHINPLYAQDNGVLRRSGPLSFGWPIPRRCADGNHERRRHDGPYAGVAGLCQGTRPEDYHHQRPDCLSSAAGVAHRGG